MDLTVIEIANKLGGFVHIWVANNTLNILISVTNIICIHCDCDQCVISCSWCQIVFDGWVIVTRWSSLWLLQPMKEFSHDWHSPYCQCTEICSHVSSIQSLYGGDIKHFILNNVSILDIVLKFALLQGGIRRIRIVVFKFWIQNSLSEMVVLKLRAGNCRHGNLRFMLHLIWGALVHSLCTETRSGHPNCSLTVTLYRDIPIKVDDGQWI